MVDPHVFRNERVLVVEYEPSVMKMHVSGCQQLNADQSAGLVAGLDRAVEIKPVVCLGIVFEDRHAIGGDRKPLASSVQSALDVSICHCSVIGELIVSGISGSRDGKVASCSPIPTDNGHLGLRPAVDQAGLV